MLDKPKSCVGCPVFGDGKGFCPDDPDNGEPVIALGQNPGAEEEQRGIPFVGRTGEMLINEFFPRAGLVRGMNVRCANTIKCRWINNGKRTNNLPPSKLLQQASSHCIREHLVIGPSTKLVVACGSLAFSALGGKGKISEWRGFLLSHD